MEKNNVIKFPVTQQLCGNCHWYRPLTLSDKVIEALLEQKIALPMVCGANPPSVILAPLPTNPLDPKAAQVQFQPQNIWPFPSESEPACSVWRVRE